ncbi:uncharacterized protein EV422DRAFT_151863 [Fimicolochytrium jonesii]|uniref:uncharacterized protein n=1 Tax=Fimicolochytrium jonesii TaxID=1396493 RepID=UPI0022FDD8FF|nr:uncharacterized protein EV422DRAFT_151863 [Fimicolochytrium jonesii]KAI8826067.1 hypothetical protein EV422DRAFT_151863 [Fimicolochytrium jonesii]
MFQLSLTPAGGDMNLPWRIVELEFLVQSTDASSGLVTGLLDHQKFTILQRAQVLLEQVQKRNAKGPSLPSNANSQIPADVGKFRQSGGETSDKKGANLFSHTDATDEAKRPKKKRKVEITKPQAENGIFEGGAFNHDPSAAIAMDVDGENLLADPKPRSKKSRGKKGFKQIRWVHNPFPILYLYEFLESLLTRLQFRIAAAQAHSLARNRWRNYLKVVEGKGREAFEVHFWDMPIPGPDPKTVPAGYQPPHKYYVLEVEVKVDQPTSNLLFERWAKKRKRTMLAHLSPEHMRYKMFGPQTRPRTYLQLRCHSVLPNLEGKLEIRDFMNPETKELLPLRLNPSSIDLGELLHNITQLQSRYIIHQLRNMVTGKPNNHGLRSVQWNSAARQRRNAIPSDVVQRWHPMVHSVPSSEQRPSYTQTCTDEARVTEAKRPDSESVHGSLKVTTFAEGDVDLSEWRPDANTDHCVARLSVRMNKSSTAIVNIDAWSGRIILRHTGRPETSSHMPFLPILEQRLNDGPNEAPEIFSFMRRAALIEELLFACQRLGLVATTLSPLQPTEESKINPSLPINKLYIRIAGLKEAWILIAVASSRDWIPEHWNIPEEIAHQGERSRQQNEPLYRVWLIETSSDGQAMIRLGRAKKEMNRRIRRITPIRVSEVFSGDSVEEYRGTWPDHLMHNEGSNSTSRDSTTSLQSMLSNDSMGTDLTQSSSGASADRRAHLQYCWDCVDMETVVSIERMCRLQHVYSTVVENLRHCGLPYEYVSLSGDEYISPDELANEESRVAGRGLKLLVGRDELAAVLSRNGEDTRTMFDDLYISVQPSRSKGFKSASNAAPNTRVPDGEPCDAYGVRVIGICGIAGAIPASMFTTQDVSGDFWTFNREQKALYFSFDTEDSIASCVELMLDTLRSNAAVALLAQKAARDKGRLEQIGVTIEPFDFRRLSFTYQKSLRVELLAKSSPDAGHPGALPIGGQNDQQWEFTSLVGEKQLANETNMRLVPPELISQIKPVWLEFIRLEKDIATAFLVIARASVGTTTPRRFLILTCKIILGFVAYGAPSSVSAQTTNKARRTS